MRLVKLIQKNIIFKIFSSVKTALVVLTLIAVSISIGTFYESRYNAEYADLLIYSSSWFQALLFLVGLLIFNATIARIPWKRHQIGFLITHLGLITLLLGGYITKKYGVDGQMRVVEGQKNRSVSISERVFEYSNEKHFKKILIPRKSSEYNFLEYRTANNQIDDLFKLSKYYPFVTPMSESSYLLSQPGYIVDFNFKSAFFDQNIVLHSRQKTQLNMGPASIKLSYGKSTITKVKTTAVKPKSSQKSKIIVYNLKTNKEVKTLFLDNLKKKKHFSVDQVKFNIVKIFNNATVEKNKLTENPGHGNPAIELNAELKGEVIREILYGKFPDFSLNQSGLFGYSIKFYPKDATEIPIPSREEKMNSNVIEFIVKDDGQLELKLFKDKTEVLNVPTITKGKVIETPWMGMKITVNQFGDDLKAHSQIKEITPAPKLDWLPPSAIEILPRGSKEPFTLTEGESKIVMVAGEKFNVYYGRNSINLPFFIHLDEFHKKDYPGTSSPMSFESHVNVNGLADKIVISMNEPLKKAGFTLYQSSYEQNPNRPTASIFSVNQDPGRIIKYLGSIILSLGIIIFTLMRSSYFRKRKKVTK